MSGITTNGKVAPIDLRRLVQGYAGEVILDRDEPYRVRDLDAVHWRSYERVLEALRLMERGQDARDHVKADELYDLAAWCCPDAPREVIEGLSAQACGVIIAIAARSVIEIEDSDPNGEGPAEGSPSPASPRTTPSGPSARESPAGKGAR